VTVLRTAVEVLTVAVRNGVKLDSLYPLTVGVPESSHFSFKHEEF